jgi:hypothetical protein
MGIAGGGGAAATAESTSLGLDWETGLALLNVKNEDWKEPTHHVQ